MIHITSTGGRIGPLCWSNTRPAVIIPDHRFAGMTSRLEFWGRTFWVRSDLPFRPLWHTVTETFQ